MKTKIVHHSRAVDEERRRQARYVIRRDQGILLVVGLILAVLTVI